MNNVARQIAASKATNEEGPACQTILEEKA